jgi:hypothetical protein
VNTGRSKSGHNDITSTTTTNKNYPASVPAMRPNGAPPQQRSSSLQWMTLFVLIFTVRLASQHHVLHKWHKNYTRWSIRRNRRMVKKLRATMDAQISHENRIDICFVSSIFGEDPANADKPSDVSTAWLDQNGYFRSKKDKIQTTFRFFLFTNLPNMAVSEGWTKIVKTDEDLPFRRFITKSRWPKFMGWQDEQLKGCETIFYFDGHYQPNPSRYSDFKRLADNIKTFPGGLAQVPHPDKRTVLQEFSRILLKHKDIGPNVENSVLWLRAQPDFDNSCTLYKNSFFGYDPKNREFQKAATFFWKQYSKEEDSWRDQPLWCYTLQHAGITPLLLEDEPQGLFGKDKHRTGHNDHQYDEHADGGGRNTHVSRSSTGDSKR